MVEIKGKIEISCERKKERKKKSKAKATPNQVILPRTVTVLARLKVNPPLSVRLSVSLLSGVVCFFSLFSHPLPPPPEGVADA